MAYQPASAIDIRDGTYDRVCNIPGFVKVYKGHTMPTKDENLPCAVIFHDGERAENDGDPNCGPPEFLHHFTLSVDVIAATAENEAALDQEANSLAAQVYQTLLSDATWVKLFEGIEQLNTTVTYGIKESSGYFVQVRIEFEVTFRSYWEPNVVDDFALADVHTETRPNGANYDNPIFTEIKLRR